MTKNDLEAIVVVDGNDRILGIVEREKIIVKLLFALKK